jgi:DNA polymerase IV (DinB-like DNA polymerase)
MLVDLDYFFAQAEETRNPSLKGKPVVVCVYSGRSEDSGAVSTANYVARQYGVKSGIPITLAKRRLQNIEAVFLPVDHVFYEEISANVMNILRSYADSFEEVGVDEAYLDVTRRVGFNFEEAKELARKIKDDIKAQLHLTCSIGVGPNKLVAKIASDLQKPDGLTVIMPEQVKDTLFPMPVERLVGVGARTMEKMQALGIKTIGDLAKHDMQGLIEVFGKRTGTYFHYAALGIHTEPVQERGEAESIGRISTLKEDVRDLASVMNKADQLCNEIHKDLTQRDLRFKTIGIYAVLSDMSVHSRSKTLDDSSNDLQIVKDTVRELFEKFLSESNLDVRRVGVKLSNLVRPEKRQKTLPSFMKPAEK